LSGRFPGEDPNDPAAGGAAHHALRRTHLDRGESIAIVDSGGHLLMLHRLENAQLASVRLAEAKARTAVEFRRPTKVLEDAVAGGGIGLRVLTFGACLADGGVPIIVGGKIIGAIGVSGAAGHEDAQVATAGAAAAQ
jgi:uncharacterized protein GlcG (DUF336 family)